MKFGDLIGILPESTSIVLFVDNMYYATNEFTHVQFKQFQNAEIIRMQVISSGILTMEISTLDLEA